MSEETLAYPRVGNFATLLGRLLLSLMGWRVEGPPPNIPKYVVLFAPHTSNWDMPIILAIAYLYGLKPSWMGKKEIFRWPVEGFFRRLGGIPVNRQARTNFVQQMVERIEGSEQIVLGITPEGTRSKSKYWKTGFYHIAHQAQVPIVFAYLDYRRKAGGFGPVLATSGDLHADMGVIRRFFGGIAAKYPHQVGEIAVRPEGAR